MSVLPDDGNLYLENIEEYVKDDRNIVTCKWLSRTLSVSMNTAKKMLHHYVSQHSPSEPLSVLYCVTGKMSCGDSDDKKVLKVQLVPDQELEDVKSQYSELWSVHVYSVQAAPVKESYLLHASDYEVMRDNLAEYSKWNTISCDIACSKPPPTTKEPIDNHAWSSETHKQDEELSKRSFTALPSTERTVVGGGTGSKSVKKDAGKKKKPLSKGSMSTFFNKKPSGSTSTDNHMMPSKTKPFPEKTAVVGHSCESELAKAATKLTGQENGQVHKSEEDKRNDSEESNKPVKIETTIGLQDSDFEDEEDNSSNEPSTVQSAKVVKKSAKSPMKHKKKSGSTTSKAAGNSTAGNSNGKVKKKRRRIHGMSSGEESDTTPSGFDEATDADVTSAATVSKSLKPIRKKVRRLVPKMYLGEDGSMITERQWEEVSTDASSCDEKENEKAALSAARKKTTELLQSPSKRAKQSSLMSFFKK